MFKLAVFCLLLIAILPFTTGLAQPSNKKTVVYVDSVKVDWEKTFVDPNNIINIQRTRSVKEKAVWITRSKKTNYITATTLMDRFDSSKIHGAIFVVDGIAFQDTNDLRIEYDILASAKFLYSIQGSCRGESLILVTTKCPVMRKKKY